MIPAASHIRRVQGVCFALSHIPLAAVVAVLLADGADGDLALIGAAFAATLVTAVALVVYLGRTLQGRASASAVWSAE